MTLDIKDRLYTSSEVAEILGVSLRSVYRYLEEGKLDADIKTATGRHRFSKKNILDFLQPSTSSSRNAERKDLVEEPLTLKTESINQVPNKFSSVETVEDDFDFDNFFETDVVKKDDSSPVDHKSIQSPFNDIKGNQSNYMEAEDDLEKLFEELEKEFAAQKNPLSDTKDKQVSKLTEDEVDFDFSFLDKDEDLEEYLKVGEDKVIKSEKKESNLDDFDYEFLDSFFESPKEKKTEENSKKEDKKSEEDDFDFFNLDAMFDEVVDTKDISKNSDSTEPENSPSLKVDDSESWLEKFRKASEKVNEEKPKKTEDDFDLTSFFTNKKDTSTISLKNNTYQEEESYANENNEFKSSKESRKKEYYYISSLSGPKEIAQTIDKVSRKFDLDYAFTMNAGLSLHKDISPFTLIHVYINERDLEIFEDYLKLTPSSERDAHICVLPAKDREIFEDSYELNGLFVVSNVQLRSDFIDKGMDNYAREV